jgi:hypothetical protein
LVETAWQSAWRELDRIQRQRYSRLLNWVSVVVAVGLTAGPLVSANKGTPLIVFLSIVAAVGGPFAVTVGMFLVQLARAPYQQRNEARDQLRAGLEEARDRLLVERERFDEAATQYRESFDRKYAETEGLRGQLGRAEARIRALQDSRAVDPPHIPQAARVICSELVAIEQTLDQYITGLEALPENQGLHYARGFRLPTKAWEGHSGTLAADESLFAAVQPAYTEVVRLHTNLEWRETGAKGLIGVNVSEDDLPRVRDAVRNAIKALDKFIGKREEIQPPRAAKPFIDEYDDAYQLRQAISGAQALLGKQRRILTDWKLLKDGQLDPTFRGNWERAGQKKFLLKDHQFSAAFAATEASFEAIALIDPTNVYNDLRLEAIEKIDIALDELVRASGLIGVTPNLSVTRSSLSI